MSGLRRCSHHDYTPCPACVWTCICYHHDLLRHKAANKIQWNTTEAHV